MEYIFCLIIIDKVFHFFHGPTNFIDINVMNVYSMFYKSN